MRISEVLEVLGSRRVIWIDDVFNETPERLASMLVEQVEITRICDMDDVRRIVGDEGEPGDDTREELLQYLSDLSASDLVAVRTKFFEGVNRDGRAGRELNPSLVERACELLGVAADDRWHFQNANDRIDAVCEAGDAEVSYVVDLNDAVTNSPQAGVEILLRLGRSNSLGTAFVLTHDTAVTDESAKELELSQGIRAREPNLKVPVCVIAKERLLWDQENGGMEEALRIAIKRAGLRRSVHEVVWKAKTNLTGAFENAAQALMDIPPEVLESHVVERAFKEGTSELHVVERALTAHMSRSLRHLFATDTSVRDSAQRMRSLRQVKLSVTSGDANEHLADFRKAEVWEPEELINTALAPLACGDVFETELSEFPKGTKKRRFLLLGQPCDISIRPGEDRPQATAIFVPLDNWTEKLKNASIKRKDPPKENVKTPLLPFLLDGVRYACDFRNATSVRLAILDLASYRADGAVRLDQGHTADTGLLPGHARVYSRRVQPIDHLLTPVQAGQNGDGASAPSASDPAMQLTFAFDDSFKGISGPSIKDGLPASRNGRTPAVPRHVTWKLRRCGRIRMPYASALLDDYMSVMSRQAFDIDYMTGGSDQATPAARKPAEQQRETVGIGGGVGPDSGGQPQSSAVSA